MAVPPPRAPDLNNYASLQSTLTSFLTVAIHTILYERALYPKESFISARAYRFPVRQSRHPQVCEFINHCVESVENEVAEGRVERINLVVYDIGGEQDSTGQGPDKKDAKVVERWVFDIGLWPVIDPSERLIEFSDGTRDRKNEVENMTLEEQEEVEREEKKAEMIDIEEQLRGTIRKLAHVAEKLPPLPTACTWSLAVELRDDATAPLGHPQPWIPSPPVLQKTKDKRTGETPKESVMAGAKSIPVRAVEAGIFTMDSWVERAI